MYLIPETFTVELKDGCDWYNPIVSTKDLVAVIFNEDNLSVNFFYEDRDRITRFWKFDNSQDFYKHRDIVINTLAFKEY